MARTVMIVDDSTATRSLIAKTLVGAGFATFEANHAYDALNQLRTIAAPTLVITDLNMPMMHGIAFVQQLRRFPLLRHTPVLLLTTESRPEEKEKARAAGASGWITKPFSPDQLIATVERVLSPQAK